MCYPLKIRKLKIYLRCILIPCEKRGKILFKNPKKWKLSKNYQNSSSLKILNLELFSYYKNKTKIANFLKIYFCANNFVKRSLWKIFPFCTSKQPSVLHRNRRWMDRSIDLSVKSQNRKVEQHNDFLNFFDQL